MTLGRAQLRESAEWVLDANAVRLFEQEIIDAESLVERRRRDLCELLVAVKEIEREMETERPSIARRERQAAELLARDPGHPLLEAIAEEIAECERVDEAWKEVGRRTETGRLDSRLAEAGIDRKDERKARVLERLRRSNTSSTGS